MHLLDHTYESPAENLACDEYLLDQLESGEGQPTLRLWESPTHFVVVGYANKIATEVNIPACQALNIPIHRRTTGGGTVVQGPGCLNYSLILPITDETASITETNCHIMRRHRDAISTLLNEPVEIKGHTDLTLGPLKFSGNAQRRKARSLIFHGCFLYNFDLPLIDQLLLHPTKEPGYRAHRPHHLFLTNLNLPASTIKTALIQTWSATEKATAPTPAQLQNLLHEKYANPAWNQKF